MMTEKLTTIARPYALAAFEYALDKHDLAGWEAMLHTAAIIAQDTDMAPLLTSPEVTQKQLVELFCGILGAKLDAEKKNFISLLGEYNRLDALPEILALFSNYRAQYEKSITVEVFSATKLENAEQQKFIDALTRRLKRKVTLQCAVDDSLIGGALIRAGNMVIDGSVRGKLNRLLESL
ncbi:MAG: F0F1 ATP synthase subunit delta [Gammaproteobacteria bacterium]